ncbi:MAG: fructose-6-phosphate aldolase [Chloroflexi bacterium]|nr:fructose-6-phosphate aldolase [Chloroflexota bacterium]
MRIFLDTANVEEIRHGTRWGVIGGVTTNPSLVAKEEGADFKQAILEICSLVDGPVCAEVLSGDADSMVDEARELASWAPNIVVKIPITPSGLEAASALARDNIKTNLTLCFSVNQALLSALAGASYVSPFVGRLDDVGQDGMSLVADIVEVFRRYQLPTQVVAASLRHPMHCLAAAKAGAHIATVPYKVLTQMVHHPLTDVGIQRFAEDWQKAFGLTVGLAGS